MTDSWCTSIRSRSGNLVHGGAARNVRIAATGGMDEILDSVARDAARAALERATDAARRTNMRRVK